MPRNNLPESDLFHRRLDLPQDFWVRNLTRWVNYQDTYLALAEGYGVTIESDETCLGTNPEECDGLRQQLGWAQLSQVHGLYPISPVDEALDDLYVVCAKPDPFASYPLRDRAIVCTFAIIAVQYQKFRAASELHKIGIPGTHRPHNLHNQYK